MLKSHPLGILVLLSGAVFDAASTVVPPVREVQPVFLSKPDIFIVQEGDAVVLPCTVEHVGQHPVVWKRGRRVLTARHMIVDTDRRLSLDDGYNLRIDRVGPRDAANFTCSVSSKPMIELTHTVDVLYSPVVTTKPASGKLVANQGQNATLECSADGNPAPRVSWRKQHGELGSNTVGVGGRLHISRISRQMAGVYECVAVNGLGTQGVGTVSIHVQYPPEVKVEKSTIYTGENLEVHVVCIVFADPPAQVSWERQGSTFDPDRHFTPGHDMGKTRHTLAIQNVRGEDFGVYTCRASNQLGKASGRMVVTGVASRAVITSGIISTAPELYELSWEVESYSPILEYKVAYRPAQVNGSGSVSSRWREVKVPPTGSETSSGVLYRQQIPLSGLRPATAYDLYVQVKNKHGWNAVSDTLHFSTIAKGEALESRSLSSAAAARSVGQLRDVVTPLAAALAAALLSRC